MQGDKALKQHKTEQKQRKKSGLVIVLTPGLGHTLEGDGKGGRQEDRVGQNLCSSEGLVAFLSNKGNSYPIKRGGGRQPEAWRLQFH